MTPTLLKEDKANLNNYYIEKIYNKIIHHIQS